MGKLTGECESHLGESRRGRTVSRVSADTRNPQRRRVDHHPNSELFNQWVAVDKEGYIITDGKTAKTNVEGVFAAGDVQDPLYRQAITAAASGCRAALDAEKFLKMQK